MAGIGFGGQWIEIARAGSAVDSAGVARELTPEWLAEVAANYAAGTHEAPVVVGHPSSDTAPAYGWTQELRLRDDVLEARFADTDDEFEQLVADGRFKKRSASFYLSPPNLRHVGFLGAQPPAIKGLRNIAFSDGEAFAVESTINFKETEMDVKTLDQMPESFWEKIKAKLGLGSTADLAEPDADEAAAHDIRLIVEDAVKAASAEFAEQIEASDKRIAELESAAASQASTGIRSEIASFVESIPADKGRHLLKRAGIAEFMQSLAEDDRRDGNATISFSEAGEEHSFTRLEWFKNLVNALPQIVEFGEKFGSITATREADARIDPVRVNAMKAAAGVADTNGGAN